jgi:uncharacterized protein YabE (DUF348 family)
MAKKRKTSATTVKVGRTGGKVEEYELEGEEPTVGDALEEAGISVSKGDRIRMDGDLVDRDTIVEAGAIIMVSGKVSGGNI